MLRHLIRPFIKRLSIAIPSLVMLTLIAFYAATHLPGDALSRRINAAENGSLNPKDEYQLRQKIRQQEGLDLPLFYFSIGALGECDTLARIADENIRDKASALNARSGQWTSKEQNYINTLLALNFETKDSLRTLLSARAGKEYEHCLQNKSAWKHYIPCIRFYGDNQYHRFLFGKDGQGGYLRGDMGRSYQSGLSIGARIFPSLKISLLLSLGGILLAYLFSIPMAVHAVLNPKSKRSKLLSLLQFLLPALPSFFVAALLLFLFANPDNIALFPAAGIRPTQAHQWNQVIPYLILPLLTYSYTHIYFVSRTVQTKLKEALEMPFAAMLRMNGVSEKNIAYRYALPLSYVPLLQLLAHAIPASIAGSIIIEHIFSIPGMGSLLFDSIALHDYSIIIAIFTLVAVFTWLAYLISDLLAMLLDRRLTD